MVTRTDGYSFLLGAGSLSTQTREDVAISCTAMATPQGGGRWQSSGGTPQYKGIELYYCQAVDSIRNRSASLVSVLQGAVLGDGSSD